jgi:hypothetical protein
MKRILFIAFILGISSATFAQKQVRKDLRSGNKEYKKENYTDAEVDYRQAISGNAHSIEGAYNLGNALYRQGKAKESLEQYQVVVSNEKDKSKLAKAYHNAGNVFMATAQQAKKENQEYSEPLKKSIEAYKNSLKNNPKDDETRYNLALAQKLLKDSEGQGGGKDQNQDKDQDKQDQQQQNQDKKEDKKQEPQQQNPNQMSKENADQILDAMMQEEKNTQEKVKAEQMQQQKRRKTSKNW